MSSKLHVLRERKNCIQNQYAQYKRKHAPSKTIEHVNRDLDEQKNVVRLIRQQLKELNIDPSQWKNVIQRATLNGLNQLSTESDFLVRFVNNKAVNQARSVEQTPCYASQDNNALQKDVRKSSDLEKQNENAAPVKVYRKPSDRWRKGEPYNVAEALFGNDIHGWSTDSSVSDMTVLREMIEDCQNESSLDHSLHQIQRQQQQPIMRSHSTTTEQSQSNRSRWRTPVKELPTEHWFPQKQDSKRKARDRQHGEVISNEKAAWMIPNEKLCRQRPCTAPSQSAAPNNRRSKYRRPERQRLRLRNPKKIKFGLPYDLTRVQSKIKVLVESDRQYNRLMQRQLQQNESQISEDQCNEDCHQLEKGKQESQNENSRSCSSKTKSPLLKPEDAYTTMEISLDSCYLSDDMKASPFSWKQIVDHFMANRYMLDFVEGRHKDSFCV